jgi:hypothetical protein
LPHRSFARVNRAPRASGGRVALICKQSCSGRRCKRAAGRRWQLLRLVRRCWGNSCGQTYPQYYSNADLAGNPTPPSPRSHLWWQTPTGREAIFSSCTCPPFGVGRRIFNLVQHLGSPGAVARHVIRQITTGTGDTGRRATRTTDLRAVPIRRYTSALN